MDTIQNPKKLFVGNLPYSVTEDELSQLFSEHGTIASVRLITDKNTGRSRGIAFVEYDDETMAVAAKEALNGQEIEGRAIRVDVAKPPTNNRRGRGGYNKGNHSN